MSTLKSDKEVKEAALKYTIFGRVSPTQKKALVLALQEKEKTVCFTGHRPEKLPGYGETENASLNVIRSMLYYQIYQSAEDGYKYFISGLARGVDLWAAEYVLEVKNRFPDIKLICAKPFAAHGENFKNQDLWSLSNVIEKADELICVSESYSRDCYRLRNQYMVDRSSKLIAVVDDYKSGTGQTINYARKQGLKINIINVNNYILKKNERKKGLFYLD